MDVRIDFKRIQQLQTQDIMAIQEYIFKCTAETAKSKAKTSVLFEQAWHLDLKENRMVILS